MFLGSRVDAPQKPNCRSPEQGLKWQGLRRHLPSRSSRALVYQVSGVLLYLTSRRGKLKEKGRMRHARRRPAEGQRPRMQLDKGLACS
jgi:hypothetical protein